MGTFFQGNDLRSVRKFVESELSALYPVAEIRSMIRILLEAYTGHTQEQILARHDLTLSESELLSVHFAVKDLKRGKPLQYILGKTHFYGLEIGLNPSVLIPRPETEELVEWVLKDISADLTPEVLDIGTGSGCIALALAAARPGFRVCGCDISGDALATARANAASLNLPVSFYHCDLLQEDTWPERPFDVMISNPPYVRESEKPAMHINVLDHEPHTALFVSDDDPLMYYRAILTWAGRALRPGGRLFLEINEALGRETSALCRESGFPAVELRKDIRGKDRMIRASR